MNQRNIEQFLLILCISRKEDMAWEERWVGTSLMYAFVDGSNTSDTVHCPSVLTEAMHSAWIFKYFGECVLNMRQWFAFIIGMLSIACWLVAQTLN